MRPHSSHTVWLLVVTGIVLAGCGDSNTDSGDAKTIGKGQPVEDPQAGSDLKISPIIPELAAKWREHTLDLPFVFGYKEGMTLAESNDRPAMMYITTTWWGWCKKLSDGSFEDEDVRNLLSQFVCVIVDGDTEAKALEKLGSNVGFPHIIFLSAQGEKIGECKGYKPLDEFKPIVEAALDRAGG